MYAMATLAPRLEWPRDRHIAVAPPRSNKPLAINFLDGLLWIILIWDSSVTWSWKTVAFAGEMLLEIRSKQAGTYTQHKGREGTVSHENVPIISIYMCGVEELLYCNVSGNWENGVEDGCNPPTLTHGHHQLRLYIEWIKLKACSHTTDMMIP